MSSEIAIEVQSIDKCYCIYDRPHHRLLQMIGYKNKEYYREFWALRNTSFHVKRGETVGIVGANGSGKSTLLQIIAGTVSPSNGSVRVFGRLNALLELGVGFNPEFTGKENIDLTFSLMGIAKLDRVKYLNDILEFAEIGEFINAPLKTYSSGMYVRLAFAVQACITPDILIVDEALAVGDEAFQRKCLSRMEKLKSQGASILLVSHSSQTLLEWCDRVIVLHEGELVYEGDPINSIEAYHKILFAPAHLKRQILGDIKNFRMATLLSESGKSTVQISDALGLKSSGTASSFDYWDPQLLPEHTDFYPPQGAIIEDFIIENLKGERVNVLVRNREYIFKSCGTFTEDCIYVHFGIHIRLIGAGGVTGQRFPGAGKSIRSIKKGSEFEIRFKFRMLLTPGVYFVGGGVWSDSEPHCLHRILDKQMIRVLPLPNEHVFDYFDSSSGEPEAVIGTKDVYGLF